MCFSKNVYLHDFIEPFPQQACLILYPWTFQNPFLWQTWHSHSENNVLKNVSRHRVRFAPHTISQVKREDNIFMIQTEFSTFWVNKLLFRQPIVIFVSLSFDKRPFRRPSMVVEIIYERLDFRRDTAFNSNKLFQFCLNIVTAPLSGKRNKWRDFWHRKAYLSHCCKINQLRTFVLKLLDIYFTVTCPTFANCEAKYIYWYIKIRADFSMIDEHGMPFANPKAFAAQDRSW